MGEKKHGQRQPSAQRSYGLPYPSSAQTRGSGDAEPSVPERIIRSFTHDLNNALVPILGFTELILESPRPRADMELLMNYVSKIRMAGQNALELVQRLEQLHELPELRRAGVAPRDEGPQRPD